MLLQRQPLQPHISGQSFICPYYSCYWLTQDTNTIKYFDYILEKADPCPPNDDILCVLPHLNGMIAKPNKLHVEKSGYGILEILD